eukprot:scaffold10743_cov287-Chaetoceros_neogracile.AAC.2
MSRHGIKYPKAETQVVQSEGKKDRFEVQRVTVGYELILVTLASPLRRDPEEAFKILVREGREHTLSNMLPYDASAEWMKEVMMTVLDTPITEVSTRNYTESFDGTAEWTLTFVADNEVPRIFFIISSIFKEIGTLPIDTGKDLKVFRLVPPGISTTYPFAKGRRCSHTDFGPRSQCSTFVAEAGTAKATGYFRLYFPIDVQFNDEAETTSKLETLSSIASLNRNMTGSDAQIWDITSMRNIGDISMLIADALKMKGTGVSMKIKEIVKESGNTLYLLRIPVHATMFQHSSSSRQQHLNLVGHIVSPFFPEEMGQLYTCSEQTNVISNSASAAELEIELESLPFIEDVD